MDGEHPTLDLVFARASLLEAGVAPDQVGHVLYVSHTDHIKTLNHRKKGPKLARRWAPLVVHAALHDPEFPDDIARDALEKSEAILSQEAFAEWTVLLAQASRDGRTPVATILQQPHPVKARLERSRKAWQQTSERVNKMLGDWVMANAAPVQTFFEARVADDGINLKRLAKFTPKAA
ncbi:hypothetical protein TK90_2865 (plasmid) [Thioalkalivibrio sp. K90mix]|uniref:hypothetical protein n=1 Tax=Thioalkalivibrio sp. (strain K90mix) TaxID=396595 RepID=UPI000195A8D4|nr:hypothetical protein [Thioalkalivibrio sp. K90mix]ADC73349.1 hypothetical protein TK90_2865 [Thioalkalivibrio sp. K90mix]